MSNRYVRIYDKPNTLIQSPTTLIGMSLSAYFEPELLQPALGKEYSVRMLAYDTRRDRRIVERLCKIVPHACLEVAPPIDDTALGVLAKVCRENISTQANFGFLVDHRGENSPFDSYDQGKVITQWTSPGHAIVARDPREDLTLGRSVTL